MSAPCQTCKSSMSPCRCMPVHDRIMKLFETRPRETLSPSFMIDAVGAGEWTVCKAIYRLKHEGRLVHSFHGGYHLPGVRPTKRITSRSLSDRITAIELRVTELVAERQRIATALRAVADRFGGPVKAALEQVAREVGGT